MATKSTVRRRRGAGPLAWLGWQFRANPRPLWLVCLMHVVALGLALVLYALPHHVIPHDEEVMGIVSSRSGGTTVRAAVATALPEQQAQDEDSGDGAEGAMDEDDMDDDSDAGDEGDWYDAAEEDVPDEPAGDAGEEQAAEATAQPAEAIAVTEDEAALESMFGEGAVGSFRSAFPDAFTEGDVERTDNSYRSANISITTQNRYIDEVKARVYVVDIYVADISCLTTAFSKEKYGRGYTEWITDVAKRHESVVTINGDYYGSRSMGVIIRNGELYRNKKYRGDIAVLYWDGHMEMFRSSAFDTMTEMGKGAYQSWSFGPSLLDGSGNPLSSFNCGNNLKKKNPRSAIGYYEPGHYCFVVVDGRNDESRGASMSQLANIMSQLGCKLAYNLDGGQTSLLAAGTKLINHPSQGGRNSSDYIMIVDRITQ